MGCSACSRTKKISYPNSRIRNGVTLSSQNIIKMNSFNLINTRKINSFSVQNNRQTIQNKKFIKTTSTNFRKLLF